MRSTILIVAGLMAASPAGAASYDDIMSSVWQYEQAYNRGDLAAWTALCTNKTVIIDNFAPNVWQGPNACADWWKAQTALNSRNGVTKAGFSHVAPLQIAGSGDHAYVVVPVQYNFTSGGKADSLPGIWTLTLEKTGAEWRITSWTWTDLYRTAPSAPI